jgi:integral membrane protein
MLSLLKSFKIVALLEGISYLVLFGNMLFIKPYFIDIYKTLLFPLGMAHGLLFMTYIVLAIMVGQQFKWNIKTLLIVLVASIIPFGTFYIEKKYLKPIK